MSEDSNAAIANKRGNYVYSFKLSQVTPFPVSRRPAVRGQTRGIIETVRPNKQ